MNKKILRIVLVLAAVMLATPMVGTVMAIGPLKALEVGKNPKLGGYIAFGFVFLDDVGPNNPAWIHYPDVMIKNMAAATEGEGRMNNAIIADHDTVVAMQADPTLYENKWVYLSGTGEPQYDGHGMLYWMILPDFGPIGAALHELANPDGVFSTSNLVGN